MKIMLITKGLMLTSYVEQKKINKIEIDSGS